MSRIYFGKLWDVPVGYSDSLWNRTFTLTSDKGLEIENSTSSDEMLLHSSLDVDVERDNNELDTSVNPKLKKFFNEQLGWKYIKKVKNKLPAAKYFYGRLLFGSFY